MTTKFTATQGMQLYFTDNTGSPPVVAHVDEITGLTGLGGKRKKIDITTFKSVGFTENAGGLIDAGEASFTLIWDFTNANHVLVQKLTTANGNRGYYLASSDGTAAPTTNPDDSLTPPVTTGHISRSGFGFLGYFSMFQADAPVDDVIKVQSGVQLSGAINTYVKGAAYP